MGYLGGKFKPLEATSTAAVTTYTQNNIVYKIHSFTTVGSFTFTVNKLGSLGEIDYLIVAGGGAGGAADNEFEAGAGGGAGGFRFGNIKLETTGAYSVIVGAGGVGRGGSNNRVPGLPGAASSFFTISAKKLLDFFSIFFIFFILLFTFVLTPF
jgi:hypothetical protein